MSKLYNKTIVHLAGVGRLFCEQVVSLCLYNCRIYVTCYNFAVLLLKQLIHSFLFKVIKYFPSFWFEIVIGEIFLYFEKLSGIFGPGCNIDLDCSLLITELMRIFYIDVKRASYYKKSCNIMVRWKVYLQREATLVLWGKKVIWIIQSELSLF